MLSNFDVSPNFYVIIGSILGFFIGWFGGFFDSNQRTSRKIRIAEADAEKKMQDAEIKIREAENKIALSAQPNLPDDPGLLRLKNDKGQFVLQMDGAPVVGPLSPEKKKRLIDLITVIRPWLEGGQPAQVTAQIASPVQAPRAPASDPARELIYVPAQSPSPTQPLAPIAKKPEAEKNIAALSIVAQIDTVLQTRLADTPLAQKGVRLQESPQGGVEVYVGLDKFLSVDEVPDATIKDTIRAAIAEWEDKFTPGFKNPY